MNFVKKLNDQLKQLEEIELELLESFGKYNSLCQHTDKFNSYKDKFQNNINNINKLKEEIHFYIKSDYNNDLKVTNSLLKEKKYLKETIAFIELIIKINSLIVCTKDFFGQKDYIKVSESIMNIKKIIETSQYDLMQFKVHFIGKNYKLEEKLLSELNEIFQTNYKWDNNDNYCKLAISNVKYISTVLLSLDKCNYLDQYALEFSDKIMNYLFEPLFTKRTKINLEQMILLLDYTDQNNHNKVSILSQILLFFQSLMQTEGEKLFFQKVGSHLSQKLVEIFIEKLYKPVIRKSSNDHSNAVNEYKEIQNLEKLCRDIRFLNDNGKRLNYYNRSINELFIEERCKDILFECQGLIKRPIYKYVHSSDVEFNIIKVELVDDITFEPCLISEMMRDLLNNCYILLNESKKETGSFVKKYLKFILYIINLYQLTAPTNHEKSIQSLPLVAALFYNDCMLLSFHILLMQMMITEESDNDVQLSLKHLVPHVRKLGINGILQFLALKKSEIAKCIDFNDFQNANEQVFIEISRGFHQVILQLNHLHKVWVEALPLKIAHKFIGVLLNGVMQKVSISIISMEDICQSDGIKLVEIIDNLFSVASQLLDPSPIVILVPKSTKLREIKFVINSNLNEINDRWASGYGPLAHEFKVSELESLVKALFQNTSRRADFLASIK